MPLSRDRKLDVLGVLLAIGIVLGVGLAVFGALEISDGGGEPTPEVNFSVDRVNDTHVRLVHAGGDTVRAEELVLTIDGREVPPQEFPASVSEGDETVVQVDAGQTLRVYWTGGRATRERLDSLQT